ncbi:hypothetical protein [Rhodococcus sp. X156]|uniref:hypothetical protein n=1 Tax=Rhodococcus sp. X156 TaxID=2499145 RepID=UPI0013E3A199|nr:hypothetical protein [Rhodococcus sp. X156]
MDYPKLGKAIRKANYGPLGGYLLAAVVFGALRGPSEHMLFAGVVAALFTGISITLKYLEAEESRPGSHPSDPEGEVQSPPACGHEEAGVNPAQ